LSARVYQVAATAVPAKSSKNRVDGSRADMHAKIVESANQTDPLVRGPSRRLVSSVGLGWKDIAVERHLIDPGEKPQTTISHHLVKLASGTQVAYGEGPNERGRLLPYSKPPGTMYFFVEGWIPAVYPTTETELTVCALHPTFIRKVVEELAEESAVDVHTRVGFHDEPGAALIRLLEAEVVSGGLSGALYRDHLTYALASRLVSDRALAGRSGPSENRLPVPRLRRVVERIEADLSTDLDLKTLAAESGYSRNHFLRMFRAATGLTPHQYLLRVRVKQAQALLKDRSRRLIDVAFACGFSSDSHLSRTFHQLVGVTPSEYRRNCGVAVVNS
jgi:AraC family transcriptional regulator